MQIQTWSLSLTSVFMQLKPYFNVCALNIIFNFCGWRIDLSNLTRKQNFGINFFEYNPWHTVYLFNTFNIFQYFLRTVDTKSLTPVNMTSFMNECWMSKIKFFLKYQTLNCCLDSWNLFNDGIGKWDWDA